jgi:hypothetical protein
MQDNQGASAKADRAGGPTDLSRSTASQPEALIPCAARQVLEMVPADFDRTIWLHPLAFQGLIGAALAHGIYAELFRPDGFAKPIAELRLDQRVAKLMDSLDV